MYFKEIGFKKIQPKEKCVAVKSNLNKLKRLTFASLSPIKQLYTFVLYGIALLYQQINATEIQTGYLRIGYTIG